MPDEESWRSESAYTYIDQLNAEELAWEFLRRNPEYRAGYHELLSAGHMTWEAATNFASRWGLRFRRRPEIPATSQPVSWSAQIDPAVILFRSGQTPRSGEPLTVEEIRAPIGKAHV